MTPGCGKKRGSGQEVQPRIALGDRLASTRERCFTPVLRSGTIHSFLAPESLVENTKPTLSERSPLKPGLRCVFEGEASIKRTGGRLIMRHPHDHRSYLEGKGEAGLFMLFYGLHLNINKKN